MKKNAGFGVVGIILVIAAIALLGFIGWRVYDANKNKQDASSSHVDGGGQPNSAKPSGKTSDGHGDTATYLDVKEWKIKIKLSSGIKDASYYYDTSTSTPVVRVSTKSLVDESGGTCDAKVGAPFGTLRKSQTLEQPNGAVLSVDNTNVFQAGSEYIIYATPNQPCSSDSAVSNMQTSQLADFKESLKTLTTY